MLGSAHGCLPRWPSSSRWRAAAGQVGDEKSDKSLVAHRQLRVPTILFASLALVSLLFAFGTPLYALLFYGLPGWDQLHSPFRWVFPFTLAMAVLGGIGMEQALSLRAPDSISRSIAFGRIHIRFHWVVVILALSSLAAGLAALLAVAASYFFPSPFCKPGAAGRGSIRSGPSSICRWAHVLGISECRTCPLRRFRPHKRTASMATHAGESECF